MVIEKLKDLIYPITDYHANGSYEVLKKHVSLKETEDYALMIRTTNFEKNDFEKNNKYIDRQAYEFLKKSKVFSGDILMNKIANPGSVYLMPELDRPVSLAMNLFLIRPDPKKVNPLFVYLYLKHNEQYIKSFAQGSVTQTITKQAVNNLSINLPKRDIQNKISNMYKVINTKIETNEKLNQNLLKIVNTLFKSWFIDFDPVRKKLKKESTNIPKGIEDLFPNSFEVSRKGTIPKEWKVSEFSKILSLKNGGAFRSEDWQEKGTPVIKIKNVKFPILNIKKCSNISKEVAKESLQYSLSRGDILISMTGYVGEICLVPKLNIMPLFNQRVGKITAKSENLSPFILGIMMQPNFKNIIQSISTGSAQQNLSSKDFLKLEYIEPPIKIIQYFSKLTSPIIDKILTNYEENLILSNLKNIILSKLFSKQLKINNAEISTLEKVN